MVLVGGAQGVRRNVSETTPLRDSKCKSNVASNPDVSLTVRDEEKLRTSTDWVEMAAPRLWDPASASCHVANSHNLEPYFLPSLYFIKLHDRFLVSVLLSDQ